MLEWFQQFKKPILTAWRTGSIIDICTDQFTDIYSIAAHSPAILIRAEHWFGDDSPISIFQNLCFNCHNIAIREQLYLGCLLIDTPLHWMEHPDTFFHIG